MLDTRSPLPSESREGRGNRWTGYFIAVVGTALAAGVRWLCDPFFGEHHIFLFFVLSSSYTAWSSGWKPGVVAMFLGLATTAFFFAEPRGSFRIDLFAHRTGALAYLLVTGTGIVLAESRRFAQFRAEALARQLREETFLRTQETLRSANDSLEARVKERTSELTDTNARLRQTIAENLAIDKELRKAVAIMTSSSDAILGRSSEGTLNYWNAAAERMFGYAGEEVLGKPISLILPPDRLGEPDELHAFKTSGFVKPFETIRLRKDGSPIPVLITSSPVINNGEVVGVFSIVRDLTYTKRLEEQLRHAIKMEAVGQLAGGVAHDFNNMLTVICGFSEILLLQVPPGDNRRDALTAIKTAGDKAATLTRQLLAFSRKVVLDPRVLNLNSVVAEDEKMLSRLLGEDIDLSTTFDPQLGHIRADPGLVDQMIVNLCVNSRDAMPRGGKLTIETANGQLDDAYCRNYPDLRPGDYVVLTVTDTGCGMTEEVRARIFEPFYTTKGIGKGTGLGLAMVHGFVTQSEGHIAVYSEPGMGTSFKVYLPRVDLSLHPRPSHFGKSRMPKGTETILLVEDDDDVRTFARQVLHSCGYMVLDANRGEAALQLVEKHAGPIHLLISDVVMPQMSGREVADRVRALKPDLRVMFCSGYTDDAVVRHGILEAKCHFLQKPYSPSVLAVKVRELLDAAE